MNRICTTFVFLLLVLKNTFEVFGQVPKVSSFLPSNGAVGSILTISGANFSNVASDNKVTFGGISALVTSANTSKLTVVVPAGAAYNNVTVETNGLVAVSTSAFDVLSTCTGFSSFNAKTDNTTGTYPNAVAVGDFNGDGKQDLVFANSGDNTVSVLLGLGSGLFSYKNEYPTGAQPSSVAVGDFNGDGKQDLVTSNSISNTVSILLGTGTGTFGINMDYQTDTGPFSVAVGDFNNDGNQDLATANYGTSTISLLFGLGGGNFSARADYTTESSPHSIAVGDFNNDGNQDLAVVGDNTNTVSIHVGNGSGAFSGFVGYPVGSGGFSVSVGEFNGDGNQDLAVINANSNSISVLLGTGLGTFGTQTQYAVGQSPNLVTIGDFNGDGKQDLVSANYDSDSISVLLGTGIGTFGSRKDYATGTSPVSIAVGDFNGDGQQDVATANNNAASASVLLNSCTIPLVPTTPPGNLGLYFNGANTFTYNGLLTIQTDNITIEAWVKPRSAPTSDANLFFIGKSSANGYGLLLDNNLNVKYLAGGFPPASNVNYTLELNKWTHLALVIESGFVKVYANGVLLPFSDSNVPNIPTIGLSAGDLFVGQLDEMRVYNSALTAAQISADMSSQSTSSELAYWNMDDDLGTPGATSANDQSGAGNDVDISDPVASPIWAYRVTNTLDDGSAGSLRWVVNNTNLKLNTNYIDFSIQQANTTTVSTITPATQFLISNPIILDGYSAYGSSPNTASFLSPNNAQLRVELDLKLISTYNGVPPYEHGINLVNTSYCIIQGLSMYSKQQTGSSQFNFNIDNSTNSILRGCYIGLKADGSLPSIISSIGIGITGNFNTIGGFVPADYNIVSNSFYDGFQINGSNNFITGNYIGTDISGNVSYGNGYRGIALIGNSNILFNNLVSGNGVSNFASGINIQGNSSNCSVFGNYIGLRADLSGSLVNNGVGVKINPLSEGDLNINNTVGGIGAANIIAYNSGEGIQIDGNGIGTSGHIVSSNSIYGNGNGGITLLNNGNNNKPSPVINSAYTNLVIGTSQTGDIIQVFYDSPQSGTTDQGRIYLGQTTAVGTNWTFSATLTTGSRITATATDAVNGTSPFSVAATVAGAIPTYYRSFASGNWSDYTKWEGSTDGITYTPLASGQYPGALSIGNIVSITGGTIMTGTVTPPYPLASITVNGTWLPGSNTYTISGKSLILSGGVYNNSTAATKTYFLGNVTIQSGGKFLTDVNAYQEFQNGFVNNTSSFSDFSMSGQTKFTVNNQVISGTATFTYFNDLIAVGNDITVENQNTYVSLNGATTSLIGLNANATWRLGNAGTIYTYSNVDLMQGGLLNATLPGTFVAYLGDGQKIKNTNFYGLNIGNSGAKIIEGFVNAVNFGQISGYATLSFSGASLSVLSVTGNFDMYVATGSSVDLSGGGFAHKLYLGGATNTITGTFIKGNSKIIYNGAASQNVIALNYNDVEFSGAGVKSLTGPTMANTVSMNNGIVSLGSYNLTTTGLTPATAYSASNMITLGGTLSSGALYVNAPNAAGISLVYPIGTSGVYSPVTISGIVPSVSTPVNLGLQIILTTGGANQVNRLYSLSTSGLGTVSSVNINFAYSGTDLVGSPTSVQLLNPTSKNLLNGYVNGNSFGQSGSFGYPLDGVWFAQTVAPPSMPIGNRGIYFDGVDDYVTSALPSTATDNFTMEAWVKLKKYPTVPYGFIMYNGNAYINGYGVIINNVGNIIYKVASVGNGSSGYNLELNKWTHISLVRESGSAKIYVNGILQSLTSPAMIPFTPLGLFKFGGHNDNVSEAFPGQVDEVKFFNTPRTQSEIQFDMSSTAIGTTGLVGYWNAETSTGINVKDSKGTNDGTLFNGPLWSLRVTDVSDNGAPGLGSLRQSIEEANTDTDQDYIDFSLPSGTQTIQPSSSYSLNNPVLMDGFSQLNTITGENSLENTNPFGQPINAKLNIIINGANAGANDAFLLASSGSEIKGLVVNGFTSSTGFNFSTGSAVNNNKISGCFIGTDRNGTSAVSNYFGFWATGPSNVRSGNTIGGVNLGDRNLISGNAIGIADFNTWYNGLIQNNYIGTNASGTSAIPNFVGGGIDQLINSSNVLISNNVISGNAGSGIIIASASSGNHIVTGNRIGTTADGLSGLPNGGNGVFIFNNSNNTIGGLGMGDANIIANNGANGVSILFSGINNIVLNNSIYNNVLSGIDLTSNPTFGNNGKSAPFISNAFTDQVFGTCQSGDLIQIFYDSPQFGATDQGRVYLGQATTIGTNWSFAATLTIGSRITATATDGVNGTSPFSIADTVINPISGAALNFDGVNDYVATNLWSTALKNITMEASVYWNGTTGVNQQIMLNGNSGSSGYGLTIQGGAGGDALCILQGGSAWISSGTVLSTNSWHHIAAANDNGTWYLYLDGIPLSLTFNTAIPNSITGVTNSFIGSNQIGQENFNGTIDNVRFWNRPLCQAEIIAHLGCERPSNTAGLIAKYDFNEGYAGDINSSVTTLVDSSGNGNTGTLTGFALSNSVSNWVSPGSVISGSTCSGLAIAANSTWTWLGNSTDWFSPCNWDKLLVPNAASDVIIPGGTTFAPTITGSPALCNTITINSDNGGVVNLDTSGGGTLIVTQ